MATRAPALSTSTPTFRRWEEIFRKLPWKERLIVRARWFSAPLQAVCEYVPSGAVADVGCGHGLMVALLALGRPDRTVVGVDPDSRKIAWARQGPGQLPNVTLREGTIESLLPGFKAKLEAVVVSDVLYLLPVDEWVEFLSRCRALLRPGGVLLLKEAESRRSWKYVKCLAQEWLMVKLLKRTRASGGLNLLPRAETEARLRQAGFRIRQVCDLSAGYSTPHVLFTAEAR